jgi:hypothetical protein
MQKTATLNGTVDPNDGTVSECKFEYGPTVSYGTSVACASLPGSGNSAVAVSASLTGLAVNTTYHFRIVATNAGGTSQGSDESFKTAAVPTVTLSQPTSPSNVTDPTFSGTTSEKTTSEKTEVVVHVYEGTKAEGTEVAKATGAGNGSTWESSKATLAIGKHVYTAVATQASAFGPEAGTSNAVTFEVDTLPPTVTLNSQPEVSNDTTPSFSGTAREGTASETPLAVTVSLYKGAKAEGEPIDTLKAQVVEHDWTTPAVPALTNGEYTAIAKEKSALGNEEGVSSPVTFVVDTASPTVRLNQPPSPSNDTIPTFSGTTNETTKVGTTSETEPVTVEIYEGATAQGSIVATATAKIAAGGTTKSWTSEAATPALPKGEHTFTAVAVQSSEIKNGTGRSEPVKFVVNTLPPKVVLDAVASPSNERAPSFVGTASEATQVTVYIYEGSSAEGAVVSEATTTAKSEVWEATATQLPPGDHTYTAIAKEKSGIGNETGVSAVPRTFVVDTEPPVVTLLGPPSPSGNPSPHFSGESSDHTQVTVYVYRGASVTGELVATATAEGAPEWISGKTSSALKNGEYTAVAKQPSSIESKKDGKNKEGVSTPVTFQILARAPTVAAEAASSITRGSALLNASVDPNGGELSGCTFEYGPTSTYGGSAECAFSRGAVECAFSADASGPCAFPSTAAVQVYARIFGLSAGTKYYFHIVATNEGVSESGIGVPPEEGFNTLPPAVFTNPTNLLPGVSGGTTPPPATTAKTGGGGIAALIAAQLAPSGRAATIAALLRSGVFDELFKAPEAGTAVIDWYYLPPGAKLARAAARSPVLVASGKLKFGAAKKATIKIRLTAAGVRLLRHAKRIRLTARCAFTPVGQTATLVSKTFELK